MNKGFYCFESRPTVEIETCYDYKTGKAYYIPKRRSLSEIMIEDVESYFKNTMNYKKKIKLKDFLREDNSEF